MTLPRSADDACRNPTLDPNRAAARHERAYDDAAREAAAAVQSLDAGGDAAARMRAVADAIWRHCARTGVSWVGFYLPQAGADGGTELVLGPSRDAPACSPIGLHGVCGQAFRGGTVRVVEDVRDLGSNYVACDPRDRSELVIPLFDAPTGDGRSCIGVLDLDSHEVGRFSRADVAGVASVVAAAGLFP